MIVATLLGVAAWSFPLNVRGVIQAVRVPPVRPAINGTAYLTRKFPDDARGIEWLNRHVPGPATVLEAWGPAYQDFNRVCTNTGLITVLGWEYHLIQRGHSQDEIRQRQKDIDRIYLSENLAEVRGLLERYRVDYVFVGELERRKYDPGLPQLFDSDPDLTPVFARGKTRIYRFTPALVSIR